MTTIRSAVGPARRLRPTVTARAHTEPAESPASTQRSRIANPNVAFAVGASCRVNPNPTPSPPTKQVTAPIRPTRAVTATGVSPPRPSGSLAPNWPLLRITRAHRRGSTASRRQTAATTTRGPRVAPGCRRDRHRAPDQAAWIVGPTVSSHPSKPAKQPDAPPTHAERQPRQPHCAYTRIVLIPARTCSLARGSSSLIARRKPTAVSVSSHVSG